MKDDFYYVGRKILYKELEPVWKTLSCVNYAVIKGEVLSQQIFSVPWRRQSNDIDILIDKKNVKLLENELQKLGFFQLQPDDKSNARQNRILCMAFSHQIPPYHKNKFSYHLNVDVNYDIFWGEYEGQRCSIDEFLNDTVAMNIFGADIKTLTIEKAFIQLILHHYKEMNSIFHLCHYNCIRTQLFSDIYNMIINNRVILNKEKIKELCKQYSITPIAYYMLYYTKKVFKDKRIDEYILALENDADKTLLNCYGLCMNERKEWHIPFEKRLDNNHLWELIINEMKASDFRKIALNHEIFL